MRFGVNHAEQTRACHCGQRTHVPRTVRGLYHLVDDRVAIAPRPFAVEIHPGRIILGDAERAGVVAVNDGRVDILDQRVSLGNRDITRVVMPHRAHRVPAEPVDVVFIEPEAEVVDDVGPNAIRQIVGPAAPRIAEMPAAE